MVKRLSLALVLGSAVVGGLAVTPSAAAEELACQSPVFESVPVVEQEAGRWTYTFQVQWCVTDDGSPRIEPVVRPDLPKDSPCTWAGSQEGSASPIAGTADWEVFDMSEFSCPQQGGPGLDGVNPWGIIGVSPDGRSWVIGQGTAR